VFCENVVLLIGVLVVTLVLWTANVIDTNMATFQQENTAQTGDIKTTRGSSRGRESQDVNLMDVFLLEL
jgi:hypothetical protein